MTSYFTHDNGGRPFRVNISADGKSVEVYKRVECTDDCPEEDTYHEKPALIWRRVQHVFVGESPKTERTEFSGGFGPEFRGNSILLHLKGLTYVCIGESVFQFNAKSPIVKYVSEVGNNDVPYPYALDSKGRFYLMVEKVILTKCDDPGNPYRWYYDHHRMTKDLGLRHPKQPTDILKFFIGSQQFTMKTHMNPTKNYDRLIRTFKGPVHIVTRQSRPKKVLLPKKDYVRLLTAFNKKMGFVPMRPKTLIPRL